jgi:hypothetical protein
VYPQVGIDPATLPFVPPPDARNTVPDAFGFWQMIGDNTNEVPGAVCTDPAPAANNNTLVLWIDCGGTPPVINRRICEFKGLCSTTSEPCGGNPTGTGTGMSISPLVKRGKTVNAPGHANPLPAVLHGTISNKTGGCTGLPDAVTLLWNGSEWRWVGVACEGFHELHLKCGGPSASDFRLSGTLDPATTAPAAGGSSSPVYLVFDAPAGLLGGGFRVTVTE